MRRRYNESIICLPPPPFLNQHITSLIAELLSLTQYLERSSNQTHCKVYKRVHLSSSPVTKAPHGPRFHLTVLYI